MSLQQKTSIVQLLPYFFTCDIAFHLRSYFVDNPLFERFASAEFIVLAEFEVQNLLKRVRTKN